MASMTSINDSINGDVDGSSAREMPVSGSILADKKRTRSSEMKVLADGNVVKLQKTRQRRILSCVHCHSKKIKCLRVQPVCDNCDKLGIDCKYFINERVSRGGRKLRAVAAPAANGTPEPAPVPQTAQTSDAALVPVKREPLESALSHNRSSTSEFSDINGSPMSPTLSGVTVEDERRSFLPKKSDPLQDSMNFLHMGLTNTTSPVSMLQAPIVNSISNNITNNFFNTNYTSNAQNTDDLYLFNLSSFTFNTGADTTMNNTTARISSSVTPSGKIDKRLENAPAMAPTVSISSGLDDHESPNILGMLKGLVLGGVTNFVDGPVNVPSSVVANNGLTTRNSNPNNPGLHNSLNAYLSNPAMTVNYLYGTNTDYENDNLLMDLIKHLPTSRERSFELIDRYVNSVHLLLPIMVNLSGFIVEHQRFWDHFDPHKNASPTSSMASSNGASDFNLLQFYTLFFPVLYASTISEFEEYDNLLLNQDINKYLKGFNKVCQYYNYPHGPKSIPILLGNVIIQSMSPNPSTMEMSQIIRYAKFLQLHKDPVVSLRISDWKVVKFRRMLWWIIFGLDGLSSHNFCLPPVCKFEDFNVLMPEYEDPVFDDQGNMTGKKLNVTVLAMTIKFKYDRILSDLVYQLHNGLATNITPEEINEIKGMIVNLFHFIHKSITKMNNFYKASPPSTVQEMNLVNFIKNHSWSFADRAMMLLHKKILLHDPGKNDNENSGKSVEIMNRKERGGVLSLSEYEDTFGRMQETNIIRNFNNSSISQLRFSQYELFTYENMHNNLIPSILHNLNDFLKYNDFIKFGKFNWYIKRTIPLDSIILLFVIICVKFKYEFMTLNELVIYVKLINKALFILNRKYFKNEKYKRMLSLTNLTWEFILKKYNVIKLLNLTNDKKNGRIEFFDYQVSGFMNMSELFNVMDVPQPALISNGVNLGRIQYDDVPTRELPRKWDAEDSEDDRPSNKPLNHSIFSSQFIRQSIDKKNENELQSLKLELLQLLEKIYYDLRNNFVDINDYCTFYSSLENVLHELMEYIIAENENQI